MRRVSAALTLALSVGLFISGCDSDLAGTTETPPSEQSVAGTQQGSPSMTPATVSQQLNRVRQVTKEYRNLETARMDGYADISGYVPGMGFHFADDGPFGTDLENPPVLVYFTNGSYNPVPGDPHDPAHDDDLILGAVEFLVPGDQTDDKPNIFADEESPRNLKVTEEHGWHYENPPGLPDFTAVHAWVHRGNPAGVFHPTNPNID